jgi:hypothetical protein
VRRNGRKPQVYQLKAQPERSTYHASLGPSLAATANTIARAWVAHLNDHCAAANTILAAFGLTSRCGRLIDNTDFLNPPFSSWMEDIAFASGGREDDEADHRTPLDQRPQSAAAAAMCENQLHRPTPRNYVAVSPKGRLRRKLKHFGRVFDRTSPRAMTPPRVPMGTHGY